MYSGIAPVTERSGKKGGIGAGNVQHFFVRPFVEWVKQTIDKSFGLELSTGSNAPKGAPTKLLYAHSRLSGFGFCIDAGRLGRFTMEPPI